MAGARIDREPGAGDALGGVGEQLGRVKAVVAAARDERRRAHRRNPVGQVERVLGIQCHQQVRVLVADDDPGRESAGEGQDRPAAHGRARVGQEECCRAPRVALAQQCRDLALHQAAVFAQAVRRRHEHQPMHQLGKVDGQLQGDSTAGGDPDDVDRLGEEAPDGVRVFFGEIGHRDAVLQAGPAVDAPDRTAARELDDLLVLHPAPDPHRHAVAAGQSRDDDEWRAGAHTQVGKRGLGHGFGWRMRRNGVHTGTTPQLYWRFI